MVSLLIDSADDVVCKVLPSLSLMGGGFMLFDGEDAVEEEDALIGPALETPVLGGLDAEVLFDFFEDIDERWGRGDAFWDGEAQSMGLAGAVIGILAENHHFDVVEGGAVHGVENQSATRINRFASSLFCQ